MRVRESNFDGENLRSNIGCEEEIVYLLLLRNGMREISLQLEKKDFNSKEGKLGTFTKKMQVKDKYRISREGN